MIHWIIRTCRCIIDVPWQYLRPSNCRYRGTSLTTAINRIARHMFTRADDFIILTSNPFHTRARKHAVEAFMKLGFEVRVVNVWTLRGVHMLPKLESLKFQLVYPAARVVRSPMCLWCHGSTKAVNILVVFLFGLGRVVPGRGNYKLGVVD